MKFKIAILLISCLTIISCHNTEKSNVLMKQAIDVYMFSELNDNIKVDSSLLLTNQALKLDDKNFNALNHKSALLFRKKDGKELIKTADKLIKLTDKPYYIYQKAVYLELEGNTNEAKKYYLKAKDKYQQLLKDFPKDFDLSIEYLVLLQTYGDTISSNKLINNIKKMDLLDYQKEVLNLNKNQSIAKEQIFKYWKGEIEYDQIANQ